LKLSTKQILLKFNLDDKISLEDVKEQIEAKIDHINVSTDEIAKEFELYFAELVEIMKPLKLLAPSVNPPNPPQPTRNEPEICLDKYLI
jgi:hypothetical protein